MTGPDDDLRELQRLLPIAVRGLKRAAITSVPEALRRAFRDGALKPRHLPVLVSLAVEGPLTVGGIAGRIGLSPATASLFVSDLDRAGLVERRKDADDRRRTIVSLRDEHRRPIEEWAAARSEPLRRTLDRLEPEARAHFVAGWRLLAEEAGGEGEE